MAERGDNLGAPQVVPLPSQNSARSIGVDDASNGGWEPVQVPTDADSYHRVATIGWRLMPPVSRANGVGGCRGSRGVNDPVSGRAGWPRACPAGSFTPRPVRCLCLDVAVAIEGSACAAS